MARIGRLQVSCDYGDENLYVSTYRILEVEVEGVMLVGSCSDDGDQNGVTWYDDVDLSVQSDIDGMYKFGGTNTYTWLAQMTEVPDDSVAIEYPISIANGGTGATTAAQALTNLGAASVTALDALSTTVAGKADANHNHDNYVTSDTIDVIEDVLDSKADANHTHDYANVNHSHDNYATTANFDSLSNTVAGKADANHSHDNYALATHVHDGVYAEADHIHNYAPTSHGHSLATTSSDGFMSIADKTKLSGISEGAEVNQNAFTNIAVGSSVVAADVKTDTLTLAGSNVSLTADTVNDKITIGITKNNVTSALGYTPPEQDTTYSVATTSTNGLMSSGDKSKLNGIAEGANNYTLPTAGSSLGGVKTTSTVTSTSGYTACPIISGVPYYKDTNTTYTLSSFGVTATAAELNKLDGVTATTTELNYVDGVTSNIQTQLDGKASSSHTHSGYASSSHTHSISNITNLQSTLDGKADSNHTHTTSCCTITGSTSSQSLTAGTMTRANLNTFNVNTDTSCFSASSNGVKVAKAGYYQISASAYMTCATTGGIRVIHVHQNDTEIASVRSEEGGSYASQGGIAIAPKVVYLNAGDVVYLKVRSLSSAGTLVTNNCSTYLSIVKM